MTDSRVRAAANNAAWCDEVCRAAGLVPESDGDAWWSPTRTPDGYPDAVTLRPGVDPSALLARIDAGPGASVKDSFADLDLAPAGFTVLFAASWIEHPAGDREPALAWRAAPDALPVALRTGPDVAVLAAREPAASVALNRSGAGAEAVVGVSNVVAGTDPAAVWRDLAPLARARFGALPLVGYEQADDLPPALAAGFTVTGPLRVWIR